MLRHPLRVARILAECYDHVAAHAFVHDAQNYRSHRPFRSRSARLRPRHPELQKTSPFSIPQRSPTFVHDAHVCCIGTLYFCPYHEIESNRGVALSRSPSAPSSAVAVTTSLSTSSSLSGGTPLLELQASGQQQQPFLAMHHRPLR